MLKWKDTIKMDFKRIGWGSVGWIHLTQEKNQE